MSEINIKYEISDEGIKVREMSGDSVNIKEVVAVLKATIKTIKKAKVKHHYINSYMSSLN